MGVCYLSDLDGSGATYLDEDPALYEDGPSERRLSSHPTFGGGRVWQDFGAKTEDRRIRVRTDYMTQATLDAFRAKFEQTGKVWKWSDHRGNAYQVVFAVLNPERIQANAAYRVEMVLHVVGVLS